MQFSMELIETSGATLSRISDRRLPVTYNSLIHMVTVPVMHMLPAQDDIMETGGYGWTRRGARIRRMVRNFCRFDDNADS